MPRRMDWNAIRSKGAERERNDAVEHQERRATQLHHHRDRDETQSDGGEESLSFATQLGLLFFVRAQLARVIDGIPDVLQRPEDVLRRDERWVELHERLFVSETDRDFLD